LTLVIAALTLRASSAGDPVADRTLTDIDEGAGLRLSSN